MGITHRHFTNIGTQSTQPTQKHGALKIKDWEGHCFECTAVRMRNRKQQKLGCNWAIRR